MCDKMKRNVQHRRVWTHTHKIKRCDVLCCVGPNWAKLNLRTSDKNVATFHTEAVAPTEHVQILFAEPIWLAHDVRFDVLGLKIPNNPRRSLHSSTISLHFLSHQNLVFDVATFSPASSLRMVHCFCICICMSNAGRIQNFGFVPGELGRALIWGSTAF